MIKKKEQELLELLEENIRNCNHYIEKNNKIRISYCLGCIDVLDKILGTDSRPKINMAFATCDNFVLS